MRTSVLIVDDDRGFRRAAAELLRDHGYRVVGCASSAAEASRRVAELSPDAVLLDVKLPDGDGVSLAAELCRPDDGRKVLLTSSDRTAITSALVDSCGAIGFVPKPDLATADIDRYLKR
jgi:DNA-binding NarL/FixJ family response regulator